MGSLPLRLEFTLAGRRVHVLHGGADAINAFIYPSTPAEEKAAEIERTGADIVIAGHSGLPFTQEIAGKVWHNAGVVGLPANDGTPRVWYSVIFERDGMLRFEHCPLRYDHRAAAEAMRRFGLADYAETLESGIYPTFDSLADAERRATGKALSPEGLGLEIAASFQIRKQA